MIAWMVFGSKLSRLTAIYSFLNYVAIVTHLVLKVHKSKSPIFIWDSGPQTMGLGLIVSRLALFIGPRSTFYVVVAWAKT